MRPALEVTGLSEPRKTRKKSTMSKSEANVKRYSLLPQHGGLQFWETADGEWIRYDDIAPTVRFVADNCPQGSYLKAAINRAINLNTQVADLEGKLKEAEGDRDSFDSDRCRLVDQIEAEGGHLDVIEKLQGDVRQLSGRLTATSKILIERIGAPNGPENAESVARRAVDVIEKLEVRVEDLEKLIRTLERDNRQLRGACVTRDD